MKQVKTWFLKGAVLMALMCTMLGVLGCSEKTDGESEQIHTVTEQVLAIGNTVEEMKGVCVLLEELIDNLDESLDELKVNELENGKRIQELQKTVGALKETKQTLALRIAVLEEMRHELADKKWAAATFVTLAQYSEVITELSKIKQDLEILSSKEDGLLEISAFISKSEASMKVWVNTLLAEGYYGIAVMNEKLAELESKVKEYTDIELIKAMDAQIAALAQAKEDVILAYQEAIEAAIHEHDGKIRAHVRQVIELTKQEMQAELQALSRSVSFLERHAEAEVLLELGHPLNKADKTHFGCLLPVGTKRLRMETEATYLWKIEGYATPEYINKVFETDWTGEAGTEELQDTLYYALIVRRADGAICTDQTKGWGTDDITKNHAFVIKNASSAVDGAAWENCALAMGDPLFIQNTNRIGCKLPGDTAHVYIRSTNEYYYEIVGYPDAGYSYASHKYWTGWLSNSGRSFELKDETLYYVVTFRRVDGAKCTDEDMEKNRVLVAREADESKTEDAYALPAYYYENDYIQNKAATLRELLKSSAGNGDSFFFITDEHWVYNAKQSPKLIRYLKNATGINKMFSGGDRGDDGYELEVSNAFREALGNDNYYPVVGNHDLSRWEYRPSSYAYASAFMHLADDARVHGDGSGNAYYYVDNTAQKIRYIALQAYQPSDTPDRYGAHLTIEYDEAQIEWFENEALDVEEGWTILIFTHALIYGTDTPHGVYIPTEFPSYMKMYNIISKYDGKGTIAAVFQGHTHYDDSMSIPCEADPTRSIPVIITTADRYLADTSMIQGDRKLGTITEQAFDAVVIDKGKRSITVVRIGAPAEDHDGNKMETRVFYY